MASIFRAPLYAPKPAEEIPWVGKPTRVAATLIAALIPTFFLHGNQRFDHVPEPGWTVASKAAPLTLTLPPQQTLPFFNPRTFNFVPAPDWVIGGGSIPEALLQLPALPPFTVKPTRHFDHVPEPEWVLGGGNIPEVQLQLPAIPPFTVRGTRQFNHVPEPGWTNGSLEAPLTLYLPVQAALPFSNPRDLKPFPEPGWVAGGGAIPEVLLQLPALPPFTVKGTRRFDLVPEPGWTSGSLEPPLTLYLAPQVVLPFSNPRHLEPFPEPGWTSGSRPTPLLLELAQVPFTVKGTLRFNHVPEPGWVNASQPVPLVLAAQPPVVLPFANPRTFNHVAEPRPHQEGLLVPLTLILPPLPPAPPAPSDTHDGGHFTKKQLYEWRKRQKRLAREQAKLLGEDETRRQAIRAVIAPKVAEKPVNPVDKPEIGAQIALPEAIPYAVQMALAKQIEDEDEEIMMILSEIL